MAIEGSLCWHKPTMGVHKCRRWLLRTGASSAAVVAMKAETKKGIQCRKGKQIPKALRDGSRVFTITIGRSRRADVQIRGNLRVSRLHCVLLCNEASVWIVNWSKNGTYIDGTLRSATGQPVSVGGGSVVSLLESDDFRFVIADLHNAPLVRRLEKTFSECETKYSDHRDMMPNGRRISVLSWNVGHERQFHKSHHAALIAGVINSKFGIDSSTLFIAALQEVSSYMLKQLQGLVDDRLVWIMGVRDRYKRNVLLVGRAERILDRGTVAHGGHYAPLVFAHVVFGGMSTLAASVHVDSAGSALGAGAFDGVTKWLRQAGTRADCALIAGDFNRDLRKIQDGVVVRALWPLSGFNAHGWPFGTYHGYLNSKKMWVTQNRIIDGVLTLVHSALRPQSAELLKVPDFGSGFDPANGAAHTRLFETVFRPCAPADHFPVLTTALFTSPRDRR